MTFFYRDNTFDEGTHQAAVFDRRWHRRALAGDSESVALLAREVLGPLFRFCFHRVGRNQALAEDVVQETLLVAIERLEAYDPSRSDCRIWGWITGLARNEIRRALGRYEQGISLEQFWAAADARLLEALQRIESDAMSDSDVLRQETRDIVNLTMSQLPIHYQQALEAKYVFGKTLRQMAAGHQLSVEAIESLLCRARRAFREAFEVLSRPIDADMPGNLGDRFGGRCAE